MLRKLLFIGILVITVLTTKAQYSTEFGFMAGGANYLGDIGGGLQEARPWLLDMKLKSTRYNFGGFVRKRLTSNFALEVGFLQARLTGADSITLNPARFSRNLSFRNDIWEFNTKFEYFFLSVNDIGRRAAFRVDFKSYLFAGAGFFYNNPKAEYQGTWYALQQYQTEGVAYSKFQPCFPVGVGMFFTVRRQHRIGFEMGWRFTLTDYIDDVSGTYVDPATLNSEIAVKLANRTEEVRNNPRFVSQDPNYQHGGPGAVRGSSSLDSYLTTMFSYSYVLKGKSNFSRSRYNYIYGKRKKSRKRAKF